MRRLSETERQIRLAETKLCKVCGNSFLVWVERKARNEKGITELQKRTSVCCSVSCGIRWNGTFFKGVGRPQPGMKFGRWTVIEINLEQQDTRWLCKCDCGNQSFVSAKGLMNGDSSSCGCLRRERYRLWNLTNKSPHPTKLSEFEIKLRLSETTSCRCCGKPVNVWYQRQDSRAPRRKPKAFFCNALCANLFHMDHRKWFGIHFLLSKKMVTAFGETKSSSLWLKDERCVVSRAVFIHRLKLGWQAEFAVMIPRRHSLRLQSELKSRIRNNQAENLMQDVVSNLAALAS
jgi:hypothetical protein